MSTSQLKALFTNFFNDLPCILVKCLFIAVANHRGWGMSSTRDRDSPMTVGGYVVCLGWRRNQEAGHGGVENSLVTQSNVELV